MLMLVKSQKCGRRRVCFAFAALVMLVAARPAVAEPASFTILYEYPTPVDEPGHYMSVSADGTQVSGEFYPVDSNGVQLIDSNGQGAVRGFRWNADDGMVVLDPGLGVEPQGIASAISPDGSVIVGAVAGIGPYRWTQADGFAAMSGTLPGGTYVSPFSVSAGGAVVVGYGDSTLGYGAAAILADDTVIELGDLFGGLYESQAADVSDDGNIIVGYGYSEGYTASGVKRAVLWDATNNYNISVLDMSAIGGQGWGRGTSRAWSVSGDGTTIVGEVSTPDGMLAFRWTQMGGAKTLGDLPGGDVRSSAKDVSPDGSIVTGWSIVATSHTYVPFVWSEATGMLDFRDVLTYFGLDFGDWVYNATSPLNIYRTPDGITFVGALKRSTVPGQRSNRNAIYRVHIPFLPFSSDLACNASWDNSTGIGNPGLSVQPPWEDIDTSQLEMVRDLAVFDGGSGPELYAGGKFLYAGGNNIGGGIAKWDGQNWSSLGLGLRGAAEPSAGIVKVLDDGTGPALYVVGDFLLAGSVLADRMAKWDGQTWSAMGTGVSLGLSSVWDLEVFDDGTGPAIYAAVNLDEGGVVKWTGSQWVPVGGGFQSSMPYNHYVSDIAVFDDGTGSALYATGRFDTVEAQPASAIAKWDGQNWSEVGGGVTIVLTPVEAPQLLVWDDGTGAALYGLRMYNAGGDPDIHDVVKWDGQSWTGLTAYSYDSGGNVDGFVGGFPSAGGAEMAVVDDGNGPTLVVASAFGTAKWLGGQEWGRYPFLGGDPPPSPVFTMVNFDDGAGNGVYFGGQFYGNNYLSRNIIMMRSCTPTVRGDCDADGDVDMLDFDAFFNCLSGPGVSLGAGCDCADITGDGVVDLRDFEAFMRKFTGQ